jgi:polyisoprenoid-binding protein YceI
MKWHNCAIAVTTIILLSIAPVRAAEHYSFDQNGSTIRFEVRHLLGKARGEFHRFSGVIDLDRDAPERSSVTARIEVATIDTGINRRDDHLRSADFFDVARYPTITFKSRSVTRTADTAADVMGDLSMHGISRPIVLHAELVNSPSAERTRWKVTTAPLKRRDFGLVFGSTAEAVSGIGPDVEVNIEVEARRSN